MQKKKQNHWVPQAYLRSFAADPQSRKKIWTFSKNAGDPALRPIKKVAVRFYLYAPRNETGERDYSFEDKLASLEQMLAHPGWTAISTGQVNLQDDGIRKMVALQAAVMLLRNPKVLDSMESLHPKMVAYYSALPSLPDRVWHSGIWRELDKASWPAYRDADSDAIRRMWLDHIGSAVWLAEVMMKMRWGFLISDKPAFITTDNPVATVNPSLQFKGLRNAETVVLFPLSATRVLFMDNRHTEPDGRYYESDDPAGLNNLLWREAIEYMYSPRDPIDICREMLLSADRFGY